MSKKKKGIKKSMGYLVVNRVLTNATECECGHFEGQRCKGNNGKQERENLHEVHKMNKVFWQLALQDLNYYTNYTGALPSTLTAFARAWTSC